MNYSDQVYRNVELSLKKFLEAQTSLTGVDIKFLEEWDPSKHQKKPVLLISDQTPRLSSMGIDGGFWKEDIDDRALLVDTIHAREIKFDFTLDFGTNTAAERAKWSAVVDRIFEDIEDAGISVYDLEADPNSTTEVGRIRFGVENDLAHNFLPEIPEDRTRRDAIRFTPDYLHLFIKTPAQPQLIGVELQAAEVRL